MENERLERELKESMEAARTIKELEATLKIDT